MKFSELEKIKNENIGIINERFDKKSKKYQIVLCSSTGCQNVKKKDLFLEFKKQIHKLDLEDIVSVHKAGCFGLCALGPIVIVYPEETFYTKVSDEDVNEILGEHISKGKIVQKLLVKGDNKIYAKLGDIPFYKNQKFIARKNFGKLDPCNIGQYIANDGYLALYRTLQLKKEDIIETIKKSGLRGRGGAGFSTGQKWEFALKNSGEKKFVVCNCDEGDPGAFMDRIIMESDPHSIIEAMIIAGFAIGANNGIVYVRAEYPLASERIKDAIITARKFGFLGKNIFELNFDFDIEVKLGAGAYVCGEETALLHSCEGKRGEPSTRPPYPAEKGYMGYPTVINNVETLANIPGIILNGADWFASMGTEKSKGTKVFALSGKVKNTGIVELEMGKTLRDIVFGAGGGVLGDKKLKAIQMGGPSGGCIPAEFIDTQIDYESLKSLGSMMGSGGAIVLDEDTCMVDIAKFFLKFSVDESCGKCTPCRIGNMRMLEILTKITDGKGEVSDLEELEKLANYVKENSLCGLGQNSPNPVLSTLKYFKDEYMEHIVNKHCPAKICKNLVKYEIDKAKCVGCSLCAKNCPVVAIGGNRIDKYTIIQDKCIKCGKCQEICPVNAIGRC